MTDYRCPGCGSPRPGACYGSCRGIVRLPKTSESSRARSEAAAGVSGAHISPADDSAEPATESTRPTPAQAGQLVAKDDGPTSEPLTPTEQARNRKGTTGSGDSRERPAFLPGGVHDDVESALMDAVVFGAGAVRVPR